MRTWRYLAAAACLANTPAPPPTVTYAPAPAWVAPPPLATTAAPQPGAPTRVVYYDQQVHVDATGSDLHTAWRMKLLAPQALAAGNLTLEWSPFTDPVTVNRLIIWRDGKPQDVLATQRFDIIQREVNLERAVLDGVRTAALQTAGLEVGDEIEFAMTVHHADPNLPGAAIGFAALPAQGALGAYRIRASWPKAQPVSWRATDDLGAPAQADERGEQAVSFQLADPATAVTPDGAPPRYAVHRLFQFSSFLGWSAVSRTLYPLFDAAARLGPASPIKAQAAAIAAETADPTKRAEAALKLVQERIRYVYVGLDRANYRPATVDETWARRFGDCKAKTVLLIALLRELGIAAEPVLVASSGGDGTDARLPTPQVFDHVVVRAQIADKPYWLDGTRLGDGNLALLPPPPSRWALSLREKGGPLEPIAAVPGPAPQSVLAMDIDASAGFAATARVKATQVIRGDEAFVLRTQLAALAPADADRQLQAFWKGSADWLTPEAAAWRVSPQDGALVLTVVGTGKTDWEDYDKGKRSLDIAGAGFTPPDEFKRPKDQDQEAPWAVEFPRYRCWATTIHLPPAGAGLAWGYRSAAVDRRFAGAGYYRAALLRGGVMRTVMSRRAVVREITAGEAGRVNVDLPKFDNNISQVFEVTRTPAAEVTVSAAAAFLLAPIDWAAPDAPCRGPSPNP